MDTTTTSHRVRRQRGRYDVRVKGWDLRLEGLHESLVLSKARSGGMAKVDFSAFGAEAFVPSTTTKNIAGFIYEEMRQDDGSSRWVARIETRNRCWSSSGRVARGFGQLHSLEWSFRPVYSFDKEWSLGANVQYTQRAPSSQELLPMCPHIATNQFEVGNRALNKVTSTSIDLTLKDKVSSSPGCCRRVSIQLPNFVGVFRPIYFVPRGSECGSGARDLHRPSNGEEVEPIQQSTTRRFELASMDSRHS